MQPNEVPPYPWHTVTTDYVTGFPKTADQHDAVAVFVDALTKYVILVPCSKESLGTDWAHMFVDPVHDHFGLPVHILSDRGTQITGLFNQSLAQLGLHLETDNCSGSLHHGLMVKLSALTDCFRMY